MASLSDQLWKSDIMIPTAAPVHYHLYIDECGDQNLENFSPTFPVFTLCGIIVRDDKIAVLEEEVQSLKKEFWGNKKVILHSRDIRKC